MSVPVFKANTTINLPTHLLEKLPELVEQFGFKSRNLFIEKAILDFIEREKNREAA